jgi:AcrR family transcriptional regulator
MADTPMRADAVRNRRKILDSTRVLLTTRGEQAGMDDIAAHAGVAVGTLYRHFPTKADLVAATMAELSADLVGAVSAAADRVEAGGDALTELRGLLLMFTGMAATDRAIKAAAANLAASGLPELEERGLVEVERILVVARRTGRLHPDVTAADLGLLVVTAPDDTVPEEARARWAELVMRAIRPSDL